MNGRIITTDAGFIPLLEDDFLSSPDDDCRIVCLTSRDVTVIRSALMGFYWGTRYGKFVSPKRFQVGDNRQVIELLEELEVKLMGCNQIGEALEVGLLAIAQSLKAIADKPCCNDTTSVVVTVNGGILGNLEDGTILYGTEQPEIKPETPPDGYTDEEHYQSQLCARAAAMVDGAIIGLGVLLGIESIGAIATTVAFMLTVVGIITIPQVTIPTLVALVATAYLAAGSVYAVRNELINRRQDVICLLYNGEGTAQISEGLAELFDVIISAASVTGPAALAIKGILMIMFSSDTINKLYDAFAGTNYGESDCTSCGSLALSEFIQAQAHRNEWSGEEYPTQQDNTGNALGEPDNQNAQFSGSWFMDVIYKLSRPASVGEVLYFEFELQNSWLYGVYTNENPNASYTSTGWVAEIMSGNSVTLAHNAQSVLMKVAGNSGYDASLSLDAIYG
jgi:hypothetical protein